MKTLKSDKVIGNEVSNKSCDYVFPLIGHKDKVLIAIF